MKPHQVQAPIYEYYWLYGAVEPATGESFFLEMPRLDHLCFGVFLAELSKTAPEDLCVLVLDGAPAHLAHDLEVPENIVLLFLPPYCPELNPAERLWEDIKQHLDVWDEAVRSHLMALRDHVAERLRGYTKEQLASLTGYQYLLDAVNAL